MAKRPPLTDEQRLKMVREYIAGEHRDVLAKRYKVSKFYPARAAYGMGVSRKGGEPVLPKRVEQKKSSAPRLTPQRRAALIGEYLNGASIDFLAKKYGVDKSYPNKAAKRAGHPVRGYVGNWSRK